jgi:putative ABC transport system ATP-binding protein
MEESAIPLTEIDAGASQQPPISCVDLRRVFRQGDVDIHAVDGISFEAEAGEFVAIMGPSGSGKSTFLHLLGALDRPDSGQVFLEGQEISGLSEQELAIIRRRRLGFLLQFFSLLPTLNALENVAFPLLLDHASSPTERALEALERVGMGGRANHRAGQLSGGEQQRVALARALVPCPTVVLADEPTGSLDSASGEEVLVLLRQAATAGQTVIVVSHNQSVSSYADRVVQLIDGHI